MSKRCVSIRNFMKTAVTHNRFFAKISAEVLCLRYSISSTSSGNSIPEGISMFLTPEQKANHRYVRKLTRDAVFCRLYYKTKYSEYFCYDFEHLNRSGREQYISDDEIIHLLRIVNKTGCSGILSNKAKTYEHFHAYYHRDVQLISEETQRESVEQFLEKHSPCLLKPLRQWGGRGIEKICYEDFSSSEENCRRYMTRAPFMLEEILSQDQGLARFHPQSINTVRYTTFFHEGKLTRIQAALRIGRHGSIVDNASSGGLYALIDMETGILVTPARSDIGEQYLIHPDTGVQILGAKVPRWEELNTLVEEIVRELPQQKMIGWDFALTPDGWTMIEANSEPAIQSFNWDRGMRQVIAESVGKVVSMRKF